MWSTSGTYEAIEVSDAPNPDIKKGMRLAYGTGTVSFSQRSIPLVSGQEYTMSCYVRCTSGGGTFYLYPYSDGTATTANFFVSSSEWRRYSYTFTAYGKNMSFLFAKATEAGTLEFCGMKLELGNKATDWSPSPWDTTNVSTLTSLTAGASNVTIQYVSIFKQGRIVVGTLRFNISTVPTANEYVTIATLPEGYRPSVRVFTTFTSNVAYSQTAIIEPTGAITIYATTAIPTNAYIVMELNFGTF